MKKRKIWITIDTEMDADPHWHKAWPPQYSSVTEGIPKLLRPIWDLYDAHPVYFVSPEVLYDEGCVAVLRDEASKGAVIGAHLHPEYIEPEQTWGPETVRVRAQFPCCDCTDETERAKLINLTKLIEEKIGVRPVWYRAARFGADFETIKILKELGYRYDASVTPCIDWSSKGGPDHSRAPKSKYIISDHDLYQSDKKKSEDGSRGRITEYPVTIFGKRWGLLGKLLPDNWLFYRWLRPSHMTWLELKKMIDFMDKKGINEGCMMFHSMEVMINKTPYVRNKWMQKYYLWRLKKVLGYALLKGYDL